MYEEFKKIKIKDFNASKCTEIQDDRHADMLNICLLIIKIKGRLEY